MAVRLLDSDENEEDAPIPPAKKLEIHTKRLTDTKRKIKLLLAGVLVLGGLQIVYSQRGGSKLSLMDMLSLITSWYILHLYLSHYPIAWMATVMDL